MSGCVELPVCNSDVTSVVTPIQLHDNCPDFRRVLPSVHVRSCFEQLIFSYQVTALHV